MGSSYNSDDYAPIDLQLNISKLYALGPVTIDTMDLYVSNIRHQSNSYLLYGGYLEQRGIYTSVHFLDDSRNIHLGLDIWAAAETSLYAIDDMVVHSMQYNSQPLDYGYTLIFYMPDSDQYILLGHLSKGSIQDKNVGDIHHRGGLIA